MEHFPVDFFSQNSGKVLSEYTVLCTNLCQDKNKLYYLLIKSSHKSIWDLGLLSDV